MHAIAWGKMCADKKVGGLGLRELKSHSIKLLWQSKWNDYEPEVYMCRACAKKIWVGTDTNSFIKRPFALL